MAWTVFYRTVLIVWLYWLLEYSAVKEIFFGASVNFSPHFTENKKWHLLKHFSCRGKNIKCIYVLLIPSCDDCKKNGFPFGVLMWWQMKFLFLTSLIDLENLVFAYLVLETTWPLRNIFTSLLLFFHVLSVLFLCWFDFCFILSLYKIQNISVIMLLLWNWQEKYQE